MITDNDYSPGASSYVIAIDLVFDQAASDP
jgi:hypothetical protein